MPYSTKKLACEFFHIFSRFEYALKRCGFLQNIEAGSRAKPGWDSFGNSLSKENVLTKVGSEDFQKAVKYLFKKPPKQQIVTDNGEDIIYVDAPLTPQTFTGLFLLVRGVRNNLFHGGKFKNGEMSGSERDKKLIRSSISILEGCLGLNADVEREFKKEIFNIYDN